VGQNVHEAEIVSWFTGSGYEISLDELKKQLKEHILDNGTLFIGCDSFLTNGGCVFANAICLHGAESQPGGRYFWYRRNIRAEKYKNLSLRMFQEAYNSLGIGIWLIEAFPQAKIEIHIDISSSPSEKTFKYKDALAGMVKGAGFECKIKPEAWAANAIADKHSK
tara:strand:+ start:725 stop:1219 length:495 start_codon:yes stop_codon:yes gene_type:complete